MFDRRNPAEPRFHHVLTVHTPAPFHSAVGCSRPLAPQDKCVGHVQAEGGVADAGTEYSATIAAVSGRLPWLTALVLPQRHLEIPQRKRLSHSEPPRRDRRCLLLNAVCGCSERILCSHGYSEPASTNTHIITVIIFAPEQVCFVKEGSRAGKTCSFSSRNGCDFGTQRPGLEWLGVDQFCLFVCCFFFFFLG